MVLFVHGFLETGTEETTVSLVHCIKKKKTFCGIFLPLLEHKLFKVTIVSNEAEHNARWGKIVLL